MEEENKKIDEKIIRDNKDYQLGEFLGKGSFAKVYLATLDNKEYAIKIPKKDKRSKGYTIAMR